MNDHELETKLRSAPVPERPPEYWADFAGRVSAQWRCRPAAATPRRAWRARLIWAGDFALTTALVLFCLQYHPLQVTAHALAQNELRIRAQCEKLDAGLHRLMLNTDGMGYLLADASAADRTP